MRLERLEINGFKSFSDRSELSFDKGVTAIVGPNGCGKSNVADALTWVMGEQSAKSLRGDRMEDVIFSGSDARKPTATAEVRLRLAGVLKALTGPAFPVEHGQMESGSSRTPQIAASDVGPQVAASDVGSGFSRTLQVAPSDVESGSSRTLSVAAAEELIQSVARDVEVTRRLYRSGESEYLIDGQVCRLRDVHDLLMDTGLGAKAYAIIEQGKIGMILSSRPTDRRQLIEEAAGVTRYKSRRRSAELKLEAAHQNLLRVDDIVFEVDKQRGTLKRQAARARRYQKLRDELRRWDKVLFARKYRQLAATIESARARLTETREQESIAAARVAQVDADLGRLRSELLEAESRATGAREAAHAREIAITSERQQLGFDRELAATLDARTTTITVELLAIEGRREPVRAALSARRDQAAQAIADRDSAAEVLAGQSQAYESAYQGIDRLEAAVEASRGDLFSAINSATALRHALDHASLSRDRVAETLNKLSVELDDVRIESERVAGERAAAERRLQTAREDAEATEAGRARCASALAAARDEHEWRAKSVRAREQELAGLEARLKSIEELDRGRAAYGDAPRAVLAHTNGAVQQRGAVADYLDVAPGYERAVEACLGDLLQYVVVDRPEHAVAGFAFVREADAGRCGFLIASGTDAANPGNPGNLGNPVNLAGLVPLSSVAQVNGPAAEAIRRVMGEAWIADSYEGAQLASGRTAQPVVTKAGVIFRGPHLVMGGGHGGDRGILEMKREIKELGARIAVDREALAHLAEETAALESNIAQISNTIAALEAEHHRQEKTMVGLEAERQHAADEAGRLAQKSEQLARERRQAEEERDDLDRRQDEARASIVRLAAEQIDADYRLTAAQRRLVEARGAVEDLSRRSAEAGAAHAALVERSAALASEVERMGEAAADLETRAAALSAEIDGNRARLEELARSIAAGEASLDG
ncbi:MAG: AAA family ATPase, partial [Vicinamibacterales bacterium]